MMDIVEFAERFSDVPLKDWQKKTLRNFDELRKKGYVRVIMRKGQGTYIYPDKETLKELTQNGKTNDRK